MSKFLDETGLAYFWNKIKAALSTVAFTGSYNDLSNKPNIPASSIVDTALSSTSKNPVQNKVINTALGTKANDSDVVHISGTETVSGTKTFIENPYITKAGPIFYLNRIYEESAPTDIVDIRFQNNGVNEAVIRLTLTQDLQLGAKGNGANWYNGPALILKKDNTFSLRSGYGGTTYALVGSADGNLTWRSKVIALDESVVHTSGDESITGVKTFNTLVITTAGNLRKTDNTHDLWLCSGTGNSVNYGAYIGLYGTENSGSYPGVFQITTGKVNNNYASLFGKPDGTLTWGGKEFVYTSGDQTIAGTKTFSATPVLSYSGDNTILALRMDVTKGTNPSAQKNVTVCGFEKSGNLYLANRLTAWSGYVTTAGDTYSCLVAYKNASGSTATIFNTIYLKDSNLSYHTTAMIRPNSDNTYSCGTGSYRWTQVYAASATINTSDERLKTSISAVPDAVLDAWGDMQWQQFQMLSSVEEKGEEKARIHNGLIAQHIDAVFKAHGLDVSRYGLFCHDEWSETAEVKGEDGLVLQPYQAAGDVYALRYEEALCMEAAYQRRRADRAEARITALEEEIAKIKSLLEVK